MSGEYYAKFLVGNRVQLARGWWMCAGVGDGIFIPLPREP